MHIFSYDYLLYIKEIFDNYWFTTFKTAFFYCFFFHFSTNKLYIKHWFVLTHLSCFGWCMLWPSSDVCHIWQPFVNVDWNSLVICRNKQFSFLLCVVPRKFFWICQFSRKDTGHNRYRSENSIFQQGIVLHSWKATKSIRKPGKNAEHLWKCEKNKKNEKPTPNRSNCKRTMSWLRNVSKKHKLFLLVINVLNSILLVLICPLG